MTSGNDIGAYMLGASIAKGNAERLARIREEAASRSHADDIAAWEKELSETIKWAAKAEIKSEVRRRARAKNSDILKALIERAGDGSVTLSADEIRSLFSHELGGDAGRKFFGDNAREFAEDWISRAHNKAEIREALRQIMNGE